MFKPGDQVRLATAKYNHLYAGKIDCSTVLTVNGTLDYGTAKGLVECHTPCGDIYYAPEDLEHASGPW